MTAADLVSLQNPKFKYALPTDQLGNLMKFRGASPLYAFFLLKHLGIADRSERLQIFESLLELPASIGPSVRVPKQDALPNGPLSTDRLDPMLLKMGLATIDELVPKTQEEEEAEREERRHFGGWQEERTYVIPLAEKVHRLFEWEYPKVTVRIFPVWAAGEIVLDFKGDFNKYIVSKAMQKQEGVIYRHLLRLILLLDEFLGVLPADGMPDTWQADLSEMKEILLTCCTNVDPKSTQEILEHVKECHVSDAV